MSGLLAGMILALVPLAPSDSAMWTVAGESYRNPAVKQWMRSSTHSEGHAGYVTDSRRSGIDPRRGDGHRAWELGASTYMKYKTSTLWGNALYANGKEHSLVWNETSDAEMVYPYLSADSVGGDLKMERYAFSGGYADHCGRWAWGADLGYSAGLYFRSADPRPRNVTGMLNLSAGAGYRVTGPYYAALSVHYQKYKQSNDIEFVSEMGSEKVYHLTGMGMDYHRFAGAGDNSSYNGHLWGASAGLYPSTGKGLAASASVSRMDMRKLLVNLNKLPMSTTRTRRISAQVAWLAPGARNSWAAAATVSSSRKTGNENIFGDASGGTYPQISTLEMYHADTLGISVDGLWQWQREGTVVWVKPHAGLLETNETYAKPARQMLLDRLTYGAEAHFSIPAGGNWRLSAGAGAHWSSPMRSHLTMSGAETADKASEALEKIECRRYAVLKRSHTEYRAEVRAERAVSRRVRIFVRGEWARTSFKLGCGGNLWQCTAGVCF